MKHLDMNTEHLTNRLQVNRNVKFLTQTSDHHYTSRDFETFSVQWDTNSIGLYPTKTLATQAIAYAIMPQLDHTQEAETKPSHLLIVPTDDVTIDMLKDESISA